MSHGITVPEALAKALKVAPILKKLQEAKHSAVIVSPGILSRPDRAAVLQQVGIFPPTRAYTRFAWLACRCPQEYVVALCWGSPVWMSSFQVTVCSNDWHFHREVEVSYSLGHLAGARAGGESQRGA